jgi:CelD/BcsL family acetyltransferase involved in cellulose biosynthesis
LAFPHPAEHCVHGYAVGAGVASRQAAFVPAGEVVGLPGEVLRQVAPAWRRRQAAAWNADPGATWEWLEAGAGRATRLLLLGTPESPVTCLRVVGRPPLSVALPVGAHADRFSPCPGTDPGEFAHAVLLARKHALLVFPFVELPLVGAVESCVPGSNIRDQTEFLSIPAQEWAAYYARRSKSLRKTIRHAEVKLRGLGSRAVYTVLDGRGTAEVLPEIVRLEGIAHRRATVLASSQGGFVADVIRNLDRKAVQTHVVRVDGALVAYLITFRSVRRVLFYTGGFRADLRSLSLGSLLFSRAIARALDRGQEVDLGKGRSFFKERFADRRAPLAVLVVSSGGRQGMPRG